MKKSKIINGIINEFNQIPVKNTKARFDIRPQTSKSIFRKIAVIGAPAMACMLVGMLIIFMLPNRIDAPLPDTTSDTPISQGSIIPDWYAPRKLNVTTMTYNTGNVAPTAFYGGLNTAPRISTLANAVSSGGQNAISADNITVGLSRANINYYIDPNTSRVIEPFSLIRENMNLNSTTYIYLMDYGPTFSYGPKNWDAMYYYTYELNEKGGRTKITAYCMDVSTGVYRQLPSEINWPLSFLSVTGDGKYISVDEIQDVPGTYRCDKVYVVNTEDMSVKTITDKMAGCVPEVSPGSKYLFYNTTDSVYGYNDHPKMGHFYNFETGTDIQCPVEVDDRGNAYGGDIAEKYGSKFNADQFFDNDRYYIGISTKDHVTPVIVETATGKQVPYMTVENNIGRYSIGPDWASNDGKIYRFDFLTNEQHMVLPSGYDFSPQDSGCYTVSDDGRYVYSYYPGDNFIKCIDVLTLQDFNANISSSFPEQIAQLKSQGIYACDFRIQVSSDNTQAVLNFILSNEPIGFSNQSLDPDDPGISYRYPPLDINHNYLKGSETRHFS